MIGNSCELSFKFDNHKLHALYAGAILTVLKFEGTGCREWYGWELAYTNGKTGGTGGWGVGVEGVTSVPRLSLISSKRVLKNVDGT